jgi:hypothetical protein
MSDTANLFFDGTPIAELKLSARSHNALINNRVDTIEELRGMSDYELWRLPYVGKKCLREVREALARWESGEPAVSPTVPQKQRTWDRYKEALQQIAAGAADPALIAQEALRSRKPPEKHGPKIDPHQRYETKEQLRRKRAVETFEAWWNAGRPTQVSFAKQLGIGRYALHSLLWRGGRAIAHPRSTHRLRAEIREHLGWDPRDPEDRDYDDDE